MGFSLLISLFVQILISVSPQLTTKIKCSILLTIEKCLSFNNFSFFPNLSSSPLFLQPFFSGFIITQWLVWEHCSSPCFYMYATVYYGFLFLCDDENVHVGIEAILHVAREQHDRSMTEARAPRLQHVETNIRVDKCDCLLLNISL